MSRQLIDASSKRIIWRKNGFEKSYKNNQEITKQFKEVNSEKLFFKIFIFLNSNKLQLQKDFMSDLGLDLER